MIMPKQSILLTEVLCNTSLIVCRRSYIYLFILLFFFVVCGSEQTRVLLTSAAFVHLKQADFSKHTRNLSPASRTILLSGHAGKLSGKELILGVHMFQLCHLCNKWWLCCFVFERTLPANACEGFSPLFWSKIIVVRCDWLFSKGRKLPSLFSSRSSYFVLMLTAYDVLQMQNKYGTANKEYVRFL